MFNIVSNTNYIGMKNSTAMKRNIIKIDKEKCTGCGQCITGCPEGALQLIDGKAQLVSDLCCDGLGACIGECPEGAITIMEREAGPYNELKVIENVIKHGNNVLFAHLKHLKDHGENIYYEQALSYLKNADYDIPTGVESPKHYSSGDVSACPGSRVMTLKNRKKFPGDIQNNSNTSELVNWPVQLRLVNPGAAYLKESDLLISADCVPFTLAGFHHRFLKDKVLLIFCPKLDEDVNQYSQKLTNIFLKQDIRSITIVHMEVPCCFGLERIVRAALEASARDIPLKKFTISIKGEILQ